MHTWPSPQWSSPRCTASLRTLRCHARRRQAATCLRRVMHGNTLKPTGHARSLCKRAPKCRGGTINSKCPACRRYPELGREQLSFASCAPCSSGHGCLLLRALHALRPTTHVLVLVVVALLLPLLLALHLLLHVYRVRRHLIAGVHVYTHLGPRAKHLL